MKNKNAKNVKRICAKCGGNANWDTSYGKENYLICKCCFEQLVADYRAKTGDDEITARTIMCGAILAAGEIEG